MATKRNRTTEHDGIENLTMLPVDPSSTLLLERLSPTADDVSHLKRWSAHDRSVGFPGLLTVSASRGLTVALRCLLDRCR
jgi:hypothetical protein